jgi:hypothetical protein
VTKLKADFLATDSHRHTSNAILFTLAPLIAHPRPIADEVWDLTKEELQEIKSSLAEM